MSAPTKPVPAGSKKHRHCPALNTAITAAECGSKRGSQIPCPASCGYFPFGTANYDLWLRLDMEWVRKAAAWVVDRLGRPGFEAVIKEQRTPMSDRTIELEAAVNRAILLALFVRPTTTGPTLGQLWENAGWPGLNNDERVMTQYRRHTLPTVIEVQRVLNDQAVECVDVLEPERPPFVVFDRSTASQAARFSRLLTWLTHYPHFARVGLPAIQIPLHLWKEWRLRLDTSFAAAVTEAPGLTLKHYLAENLTPFTDLLRNLAIEYRQVLLDRLDLHQCLASFALAAPVPEVQAILHGKPEFRIAEAPKDGNFAPALAFYEWHRAGESAETAPDAGGSPRLGAVRIYPEYLVVETSSRAKHAFAKQMIERLLSAKVKFHEESSLDFASVVNERSRREGIVADAEAALFARADEQASDALEIAEPAPAPTASEPSPEESERAHESRYRHFLTEPQAELNGRTPQAAAAEPELRPQLVELLKLHICDLEQRNRRNGTTLSLNWLCDELGLPELKS